MDEMVTGDAPAKGRKNSGTAGIAVTEAVY